MVDTEDRHTNRANTLLDELTFGGHSQDGAASVLADALAAAETAGFAVGYSQGSNKITDLIADLQKRRREMLTAIRACPDTGADYWRWQGHAELSRQLLEQFGAEVPR